MRRKTSFLFVMVLLMCIGFAAITTNVIVNNTARIGISDLNIHFNNVSAYTFGDNDSQPKDVETLTSSDGKSISFTTSQLVNEGDEFVLMYNIMNESRDYDADITFNYSMVSDDMEDISEYIDGEFVYMPSGIGNEDYKEMVNGNKVTVEASSNPMFGFAITLKKALLEQKQIKLTITYDVEATERTDRAPEIQKPVEINYFDLEPGLYSSSLEMTKSWQELLDEKIIYDNDGILSTNLTSMDDVDESAYIFSDNFFEDVYTEYGRHNTSCSSLDGLLVLDKNITNVESAHLLCRNLIGVVVTNENIDFMGENMINVAGVRTLYMKLPSFYANVYPSYMLSEELISSMNGVIDGDYIVSPMDSNRLLTYIGKEKEIIVPDNFTAIEGIPFLHSAPTKVVLPDGLKEIGPFSFYEYYVNTNIPDSVEVIGDRAFANNVKMISQMNLPSNLKRIGEEALHISSHCYNTTCLESVNLTIPDSVEEIGKNAFKGIDAIYYHGSAKYSEDNLYWGAKYLNPIYDGEYVYGDENKEFLIGYVGSDKDIVIPEGVKKISDECFKRQKLNSVTLPSTLEEIGKEAFYNTELSELVIPDTVTSIGDYAFNGIETIIYHGSATYNSYDKYWGAKYLNGKISGDFVLSLDGKTLIGYKGSSSSVTIPDGVTKIGDGVFKSKYLYNVSFPESVTTIGDYAFASTDLPSISIPDSVTSIGYNAFYHVSNIHYTGSATYSDNDKYWGANTLNGGYKEDGLIYTDSTKTEVAGYISTGNTEVVVPDGVTKIKYKAFKSNSIENVTLPSSLITIDDYAIAANSINILTVPDSVTSIGYSAFSSIRAIEYHGTASYESSDKYWGARSMNNYYDGDLGYADSTKKILTYSSKSLKDLVVPDMVEEIADYSLSYLNLDSIKLSSSLKKIDSHAFYDTSVSTLELPEGLMTLDTYSLYYAHIENINLPSTLKEIKNEAFGNNYKLKTLTIPASVNKIGTFIVYSSDPLEQVIMENKEGWKVSNFGDPKEVTPEQLSDPVETAKLFKNIYNFYTWTRE